MDNLPRILKDGRLISRHWQTQAGNSFVDISIDPSQPVRQRLKLLDYVPLFPGYYQLYRDYDFNGYLMSNYDDPKVQNKSFYGTLNKVLQFREDIEYESVIILMVDSKVVHDCADNGKLRFFSDIAVKPGSQEYQVKNKADLSNLLDKHTDGSDISGEIDIYDDGKSSIAVPLEIEAIIADNDQVVSDIRNLLSSSGSAPIDPLLFVDSLPRNEPGHFELF